MNLSAEDAVQIFAAIILQAVDDYRSLIKKKKSSAKDKNSGAYSLKEIEQFFLSEWGEAIIQDGLRLSLMTGSDFLRAAIQ